MGGSTCTMPSMPEYADLKKPFEPRVYQSTLNGWGFYFMGLGALEGIEDFYDCLAGNTEPYQSSIREAGDYFRTAREQLLNALDHCMEFRAVLPEKTRNLLSPNIKILRDLTSLLEEAEKDTGEGRIPTLECLHGISQLIREDMVFGERMAQINRGTYGHFTYPDDES